MKMYPAMVFNHVCRIITTPFACTKNAPKILFTLYLSDRNKVKEVSRIYKSEGKSFISARHFLHDFFFVAVLLLFIEPVY